MKIKLFGCDLFTTVDDDFQFENVSWVRHSAGYVIGYVRGEQILLHRLIMNAKRGDMIDHIDGNKLNNRRYNLEKTNQKLNQLNRTTSHGVTFFKRDKLWHARIMFNYREIHLGYFKDWSLAVDARRKAHDQLIHILETAPNTPFQTVKSILQGLTHERI